MPKVRVQSSPNAYAETDSMGEETQVVRRRFVEPRSGSDYMGELKERQRKQMEDNLPMAEHIRLYDRYLNTRRNAMHVIYKCEGILAQIEQAEESDLLLKETVGPECRARTRTLTGASAKITAKDAEKEQQVIQNSLYPLFMVEEEIHNAQ